MQNLEDYKHPTASLLISFSPENKPHLLALLEGPRILLHNTSQTFIKSHLNPYHYLISVFLKIYLFLAVLCLRCCARAFSNCGERGLLFVVVHGLLIVVASLVVEHGL